MATRFRFHLWYLNNRKKLYFCNQFIFRLYETESWKFCHNTNNLPVVVSLVLTSWSIRQESFVWLYVSLELSINTSWILRTMRKRCPIRNRVTTPNRVCACLFSDFILDCWFCAWAVSTNLDWLCIPHLMAKDQNWYYSCKKVVIVKITLFP